MTLQTMNNKTHIMSVKQPARHQRFAASPLALMRHSKGFTLVELMVVIVIVGILSAVALPKFLGLKDKAKINTQIGEASGLAKECATAIIAEGTYPDDYPKLAPDTTNTGLKISRSCNGGTDATTGITSPPPINTVVTYTTGAATGKEGVKCGLTDLAADKTCVITVNAETGKIDYAPA